MFYLFKTIGVLLLIYVDMITYKEKDKLATYILSIGLIDFNFPSSRCRLVLSIHLRFFFASRSILRLSLRLTP